MSKHFIHSNFTYNYLIPFFHLTTGIIRPNILVSKLRNYELLIGYQAMALRRPSRAVGSYNAAWAFFA